MVIVRRLFKLVEIDCAAVPFDRTAPVDQPSGTVRSVTVPAVIAITSTPVVPETRLNCDVVAL